MDTRQTISTGSRGDGHDPRTREPELVAALADDLLRRSSSTT
jgi:hypothetical protein